jgi:hypothetical protein
MNMKSIALVITLFASLLFLQSCGGDKAESTNSGPNYLDSLFVDANYRGTLDAIGADTSLAKADRDAIRSFVRRYRKRIPEGWTYGKILESSQGMKKLRTGAIQLDVSNFMRTEVDRIISLFYELKFKNTGDIPIEMVYGHVFLTDSLGGLLHSSPMFAVQGPIAAGAETQLLRLQYAYERPTGNALNDPKRAAIRDTLDRIKFFAKHYKPDQIQFKIKDLLLEGGISVEDYFLLSDEAKAAAAKPTPKSVGLMDWAKQNDVLVQQLANRDAAKYLSVRPVLTDGYESQHGQYLLFDRRLKVVKFFTQQKDVPGRNIDPEGGNGTLESRHNVDFWGWPVELWVYAKAR